MAGPHGELMAADNGRRNGRPPRSLLHIGLRGAGERFGERLSEYRCCLAGLRHFLAWLENSLGLTVVSCC
jgi:uncharacterized membrane protein YidH (DUF202 family)